MDRKFLLILVVGISCLIFAGCNLNASSDRLTQLETKVGDIENRLVDLYNNYNSLEERHAALESKYNEILTKKSEVEAKVSSVNMTNEEIQAALKAAGFYKGAIDGKVGPETEAAIKQFQESNGLKADGVVGSKTKALLVKYLTQKQAAQAE